MKDCCNLDVPLGTRTHSTTQTQHCLAQLKETPTKRGSAEAAPFVALVVAEARAFTAPQTTQAAASSHDVDKPKKS